MNKRNTVLLISLFCLMTGCAKQYDSIEEAEISGARLGECIYIDEVDVSGLSPAGAIDAVERAHTEALKNINYTITAEKDSIDISASLLPIAFDTRDVVAEALSLKKHWPRGNEPRKLYTSMFANDDELCAALREHAARLEYPPNDASAKYDPLSEDRFSYTPHKDGRAVDIDDLCKKVSGLISSGGSGTADTLTTVVSPNLTLDTLKADTRLISSFSTSFAKGSHSGKNRVFNISKAAGLIDGAVLAPGEEFDMNAVLGDRNGENGWKTAAGIRDGVYVQEYGGGVCQVSTTLYNAVLMADLEVTERYHHSWPSGYVDIGRDATISTGGPNFKFRNTSEVAVTISALVDTKAQTITVSLYGRPLADGMKIELTSKKTGSLANPGNKVVVDQSLPAGESRTERKARRGSVSETYKLYYNKNGELIKKTLVTEDRYRSIEGLVYVSPY